AAVVAHALFACGSNSNGKTDGNTSGPPVFPADYAATYQQVRNCRLSLEHDLMYIRVLASPDALAAYNGRTAPFPTGAIALKEQYGEDDTTCAGPIVNFTVMQKLAVGSSPATLDWTWQKVGADRRLVDTDITRCTRCHTDCGKPPDGYDGTCTMP
ncbi:MAG: cytochrome P460 family protein, partial [Hyphomicrobiales bacterium]